MDALRRLRPRAPTRNNMRRVPVGVLVDQPSRLRGGDKRLSDALDQLRSGVPLNWGQVEDDPELATLARLQQAGQECRLLPLTEPSPQLKAAIYDRLAAKMPAPRPKQEKVAPKSLAGFSENVPVLTQVEDDVRLSVDWTGILLKGALAVLAIVVVVWGFGYLSKSLFAPTFSWIQLHNGSDAVSHLQQVATITVPDQSPCKEARNRNAGLTGNFVPVRQLRNAQADVNYSIPVLPAGISVPTTYTFQLALASVSPCEGNTPIQSDPTSLVSLLYTASTLIIDSNARNNASGNPTGRKNVLTNVTMFVAHDQITPFEVGLGNWHEVRVGDLHGIYWRGGPYRDPSDTRWGNDTSILLAEHGSTVIIIIGSNAEGVTEPMLLETARNISW